MMRDAIRFTVVEQVPTTGTCELCATEPASLVATVLVHHGHGGPLHRQPAGTAAQPTLR
jgi:hypothetical protein